MKTIADGRSPKFGTRDDEAVAAKFVVWIVGAQWIASVTVFFSKRGLL
jgi:hypothetical protein